MPSHIFFLFVLSFPIYFIPALVSRLRNCKAHYGILVVNFFLGWTFVGWVAALAWAVSGEKEFPRTSPAILR